MDVLSDLPVVKEEQTPQEKAIMSKYFGVDDMAPPPSQNSSGWMGSIKVASIATAMFLLFCNPIADRLIRSIPYADSTAGSLGIKTLFFFAIFLFIYRMV